MNIRIKKTEFCGFGIRLVNDKLYVCVKYDALKTSGINIYPADNKDKKISVSFTKEFSIGDVFVALFEGASFENCSYDLFCNENVYVDEYCRMLTKDKKRGFLKSSKTFNAFLKDEACFIPYSDSIIYVLSVKGMTMMEGLKNGVKGTFKALEKKLPYFENLGITSLELMPIYELKPMDYTKASLATKVKDYKTNPKDKPKDNLWGFGDGYHFAIKREYCESDDPVYEFKHFVKACHDKKMEVILMMQYEKDVQKDYLIDSLFFFVESFHVDGFRLLCENLPMYDILSNPLFSKTKILTDDFDFENYKIISKSGLKTLASNRDLFMNNARKFLKGDEDEVSYISYAVRENSKYYAPLRFITDFSGFSLYDLVSYNVKHNEANGEDNLDGTDYNYSWNCGAEGETKKKSVLQLRKRQIRNAYLLMMLTQGTPVMRAGDEFLNTHYGNNNPYCQDNEIGWVKFRKDKASKEFNLFVKNLIAFRKRHYVLHQPKELMLFDYMSCKAPDVSFHGSEAFKIDQAPFSRAFSVLYYGDYSKQYTGKKEPSVYIVYNMYWEDKEFVLPLLSKGKKYKLLYSSDGSTDESFNEENALIINDEKYICKARSIAVLLLMA